MAKVTMVVEDITNDQGESALRISVESDNSKNDDYTLAESIVEQIYEQLLQQAQSVKVVTPAPPASNLN